MISLLILSASLYAPAALACDDDKGEAQGEHCELPSAETTAALPHGGTHVTLAVAGMSCGSCADAVHAALMKVDGVSGARVDLAGNSVEVAYNAKKTSLDKLI